MAVLTHGVGDPIIEDLFSHEELGDHLLTMDEYLKISRRIIGCYASPKAAHHMLNDEDALSFVANKLMIGTCKWVHGGKRGTHRGYLSQCGQWAIQTWVSQQNHKTNKEWDDLSLTHTVQHATGNDRVVYLYQTLIDKSAPDPSAECVLDLSQKIDIAIQNAKISERQLEALELVYYQGLTLEQAGGIMGVSKQRIQQLLNKAYESILKADENHGVLDEYYAGTI